MKSKYTIKLLFFGFLYSCSFNSSELQGTYVSKNNINLIDTLYLKPNGKYEKVIYRKIDSSFIYKNIGTWEIKDGRLVLNDFLVDNDENYSPEVTSFEDILMTSMLLIDKKSNKIIIYQNQITDDIYYEKIN